MSKEGGALQCQNVLQPLKWKQLYTYILFKSILTEKKLIWD